MRQTTIPVASLSAFDDSLSALMLGSVITGFRARTIIGSYASNSIFFFFFVDEYSVARLLLLFSQIIQLNYGLSVRVLNVMDTLVQ